MKKLIVATDTTRLSDVLYSEVWNRLERLSFANDLEIVRIPPFANRVDPVVFSGADALIVRPTDSFKVEAQHLQEMNDEGVIFTVSAGREHVTDILNKEGIAQKSISLEDTNPNDNSRGVASFNISAANSMLLNVDESSQRAQQSKKFLAKGTYHDIYQKCWFCYGTGHQVQNLIPLLLANRVKKIFIYNGERLTEDKFRSTLELANAAFGERVRVIECKDPSFRAVYQRFGAHDDTTPDEISIIGIKSAEALLAAKKEANILSLHIPVAEDGSTTGIIDSSFLSGFTQTPLLINTARGELLNEQEVVQAIDDKIISGLVADVLNKSEERSRRVEDSKLESIWYYDPVKDRSRAKGTSRLTPHISGSVEADLGGMWQSVLNKLEERFTK